MNFIGKFSGNICYYFTTNSFLTHPIYCNLKKRPYVHEYSVHTMNTDVYIVCEVPTTVNVYRAECSVMPRVKYPNTVTTVALEEINKS